MLSLTIEEIKELMDKMQQTNLGKLKIKEDGFELKLEAKEAPQIVTTPVASENAPVNIAVAASAPAAIEAPKEELSGNVMKSPIVGTFYSSPAPDKDPFVTVGQKVKKGDVLFIIESMKLMNEIQSEFDGEVAEVKVTSGQAVEFGQPIMIIK